MADNKVVLKTQKGNTPLEKAQRDARIMAISEGVISFFALGTGMLSLLAAFSGAADQAAAAQGIASTADGTTAGLLFMLTGAALVVSGVLGLLTAILGLQTAKDASKARAFVLMATVTLVVAVIVCLAAIAGGSFLTNMGVIVIGIFFAASCMRLGAKVRDLA